MQKKQVDSRLQRALYQEKRHFKMFKTGKLWATVGISLLFGAGFALAQPSTTAFAATAETTTATSQIATIASQTVASPTAQLPQVTLASGWTAPTWHAADFDITAVAGKANTYTATLSAQGIAALQAANPNAKVTAQNVQAGTLTVQGATAQSTAAKSTTTTTAQQPADAQTSAKPAATQTPTTASGSADTVDSSTSDQSTTATDSDQQKEATQSTTSAPAVTALGGAATQADIDKAKTAAESAMKKTGQAQVITAMSGEPQDTDTPSTSTASITSSVDKIGYGSGVTKPFKLTVKMTVKAGDVVTFTLPTTPTKQFVNGVFSLQSVQDFSSPNVGTVDKVTNPDGTITITDTIKQTGSWTQDVTLSVYNNYAGQALLTVGDTPYTVNVAVNGKQTGSTTFTMTVDPQVFLSTPTQTHPNTSVKGLLPNTDYVWEVPVNEGDGVLDQWYQSPRVNSAVNYGTTITIPTPTGFVLNQDLTDTLNSAKPKSAGILETTDNTTIKQVGGAGGDIIITVPKGSGSQYYDMNPAYRLAGHFETTQAATDTTLTAAGPVTMVQKIDDAGTTKTYTADPWKTVILGTGTTQGANVITTANGNSGTDEKQLLLNDDPSDDPATLLQYSFQYHAAAAANNVAIRMTVPDGMAVNKIEVPAAGVSSSIYMPGTTSYSYVLTFADGTTETGTVAPGGTVTSTKNIRTAVFTPDSLAPGATSGNFKFDGTLSKTYDDRTAVKNGDQLTSTIDMSLAGGDFSGAQSFTQTVAGPIAWPNVASNFSHTETAPGKGKGSIIGIWGAESALGQNTYSVYEPIFYFDIPSAFVVDGVKNAQDAVITTGTADNGDTVVKVDFTGTKESVNVSPYDWNDRLHLDLHNAPDAMVGSYPWYAYVTSPTTSLVQTTKVTDLSQTMGDANAILVGTEDWKIETIAGTYANAMAQGDDLSATTNATIDKNSKNPLKFYDTIMNVSGTDVSNVTSILNLPQTGDDQGSTYTFNLTGPVTLPTQVTNQAGKTVPLTGAQVLYSTTRANLSAATPDLSTYVTADQVHDWSTIRSVAFTFDTLPAGVTTGRIALTGTTTNMNMDAGKIGYLATSFYMGDGAPAVVDKAASIAITGQSTIHARAHYVDADGNDQYVTFTDLDKTYTDNQDTLTATDFPATPSDADIALIPTGYVLHANSLHFVDSSTDGVATVGQTVTDAFDGDFAQYELDKESSLTVSYVDDTTKAVVGTPETFTGVTGSTGTYTPTAPAGYILATGQPTSIAYTITADDTDNIVIHVVHPTTTSELETKRKITFSGITDPNLVPKTVVQTEKWQAVTDITTGTTTYTLTTPYPEYTAPTVAGYHVVGDDTLASPTAAPTTTKPEDATHEFVYEADDQTATLKYVDDDKDGAQVGETKPLTGKTGTTADWTATVPDGYKLATDQSAKGTVTFTTDKQVITIHLTHVIDNDTTTAKRTIHYVYASGKTAAPDKPQTVTYDTSTDEVTSVTTYTPQGDYAAVTSPLIEGYTADKLTVAGITLTAGTTAPTNPDDVTVTYTGNDQTTTLKYVDDDKGGAQVGDTETLSGKTGDRLDWTATAPKGYTLASDQLPAGTVTFTTNTQGVTIHLKHATTQGSALVTRTITYKYANGDPIPDMPVNSQIVTYKAEIDEITGDATYTPLKGFTAVTSPTIDGYTADQLTVPAVELTALTQAPAQTIEVSVYYTGNPQNATLTYVDDDKNGAQVGETETLSGKTGDTTDWTAMVPAGYYLTPGQAEKGTVTFTTDTPGVTIHLMHQIDHGITTATRTIEYVYANNPKNHVVSDKLQTVSYSKDTDKVTGATTYTPTENFAAVDSPIINGYTADKLTVPVLELSASTDAPTNPAIVTVTYTGTAQTATLTYVDDDNNGAHVGDPETLSGKTGDTTDWTATAPAGYDLTPGQADKGSITFTTDTQGVTIHLKHHISQGITTASRTINYVYAKDHSTAHLSKLQVVSYKVDTDVITKATTYTPTENFAAVDSPVIDGYTADKLTVPVLELTASADAPTDPAVVTVTYTGNDQTATLKYVDDNNHGAQVGDSETLSGKTGDTTDWTAKVPAGYELASNQPATGTVTFTTNTQGVTIHLKHVIEHKAITTTRTITYTGAGTKTPEKVVQTTTWHTSADKATGSFIATDNSDYVEVNTPTIAGYTPDKKSVAKVGIQTVTDPDDIKDTEVTVTYKADDQTAQVKYVDDVNGAAVGTPEELSGKTDTATDWTAKVPTGYELAKGQAGSGTVTFTANTPDVVVQLTHVIDHGTATTTRTITYVGAGTKTPKAVVQKTTWSTSTDQATGQFIATSTTVYAEVNTPNIPGYTPDQTSVARAKVQTVTDPKAIKDTDVTVTYTADDQTTQVKYVDDDKGGAPVGKTETLNGKTDTTTDWTATIPTGYELAPDQPANGTVTFSAQTPDVTVHLKHIIQHGARTTKRTITYIGGGAQSPAPVVQTIKWLTSVDVVTGGVIATAQAGYPAVPTPAIPGYTPDQTSVAKVGIRTTTNPADLTDSAVTVTYTIDQQTAEIIFVIKGHGTYDVVTVSGASGSAIPTSSYQAILAALTAKGYKVVTNAAKGAHFDYNRTATQRLTIVLTKPSTGGPHGGLPETGLTGGSSTTTGQPGGTATGQATGTSSQQATGTSQGQTGDAAHRLPTTGDAQGTQYAVLGLMFLTGIFGLAKPRKKHN